MGRVMIERPAPGADRDADLRSYPVKAGESVQAGDVVDVVGGAVTARLKGVPPVQVFADGGTPNPFDACKLSQGAVAAVYNQQGYNRDAITKVVFVDSDGAITYSNALGLYGSDYPTSISIVALTATRYSVFWTYPSYAAVRYSTFDIQGKTLTQKYSGTFSTPSGGNAATVLALPVASSSVLVFHSSDNFIRANILVDTGSTFTKQTETKLSVSVTPSGLLYGAKVDATHALLGFSGSSYTYNLNYEFVAAVNGNAVSLGSLVTVPANGKICGVNNGKAIVDTGNRQVRLAIVSGTSVSFGDMANLPDSWLGGSIVSEDSGVISASCQHTSGGSEAALITITGTTVSFGRPSTIFPNRILQSLSQLSANFALAMSSMTDGFGFSVLSVRSGLIAGSFESASAQAIALQSGTGGQSIEVIFDGTAELPGIAAGTSIKSQGVQGYAPQDGWLWVRPEWEKKMGTQIAAGLYRGTGAYGASNPNVLTFDFEPVVVFVFDAGALRPLVRGNNAYNTGGQSLDPATFLSFSGNTVSWYYKSGDGGQYNITGVIYRYIALG